MELSLCANNNDNPFSHLSGAGNLVLTGFVQMSARGVSADFGTATFSVGAGTITSIGTSLYSVHIARVRGEKMVTFPLCLSLSPSEFRTHSPQKRLPVD